MKYKSVKETKPTLKTKRILLLTQESRNRRSDSGILENNYFVRTIAETRSSLFTYTRSARPFTSSSTALARALDSGAWWLYSMELVARPEVMVRSAVT